MFMNARIHEWMNDQHIIAIEPGKRGGRARVRHMRIAVADGLGWLAAGQTPSADPRRLS
jgi:uncharacterized protein (DUF433 family)